MRNKLLNTFEGDRALLDFLNPDKAPYTPLVELPASLNPYKSKGVRIFAKLMSALPLANMKSLPAYSMLLEKKRKGGLRGVDTIIENSSGNTVLSLAVIARLMGIPHTKAVASHEVSPGKLNLLRFLGTEVIINREPICPDPKDPESGIHKARMWAEQNRWFNPGQYDNPANPKAHRRWTGPQIWEQTGGRITLLSIGLGTTGSAVGVGQYLRKKNEAIELVGALRAPNNPVPGVRTANLLKEIAFDWESQIDHQEEVGSIEAYRKSLEMCRMGLFVGPSSGLALSGLLKHLSKRKSALGERQIAVFVCPDSPFPYIEEYFQCLDEGDFPKIENAHLLKERAADSPESAEEVEEIEPKELLKIILSEKKRRMKSYRFIDVREEREYEDHHIPGAENVPLGRIEDFLSQEAGLEGLRGLVFVCARGNRSRIAAAKAKHKGLRAISLKGGSAEWSRLGLPRIRPEKCILKFAPASELHQAEGRKGC